LPRAILKHCSLSLESGERLGIVGESGSGKTLLCKALLRARKMIGQEDPQDDFNA